MAKYKAYPEYKDSGVEWLGEIPDHWPMKKISWYFSAEKGKKGQLLTKEYCGSHAGIYPVYSGQTENNGTMGFIDSYEFNTEEDGVLFSTTVGAKAMSLNHLKGKFSLSQNCMIILPKNKNALIRFFFYHFQPLFQHERSLIPEHMQASFRMEDLYQYSIALPPKNEQLKITKFLDHETAKIDNLIEKQQQLIELLKEKRQAVISHAITKGLNPDVPMKDSGVEWLGEVPQHWTIKPLRYLGDCQNGINIGAEAFGSGFPFVSYGDAYKNRVLPENGSGLVQSTAEDRRKYSLLRGDVLFTRTSETIEEIGFASACIKSIENACFAGFLIRFRPTSSVLYIEYSKYYFSNQLLRIFFTKEMNLITRASLSQDLLKTMPVVIPPVDEQIKIAELLDSISEKFDQLQLLGEEQIKYLQERRTALISAAVTGKIDVRDWVAPDTQDVEEPEEATA